MVTFTQYHGMNFSSVIGCNHKIFYIGSKVLLNSRDFVIEVTFFHIIVFLKSVVTPWKIHTVISLYTKALKFLPEKYFADIVDLAFIGQIKFSQNFENNWNKNVNFRKSIQNHHVKLKFIPENVS